MSKGFGIAALVFALLAIPVPFGIILSLIACGLAVIAALAGDKIFATATPIISFVNALFLSPTTWLLLAGDEGSSAGIKTLVALMTVLPFVAMLLHVSGTFVIGKR